MFSITGTRKKLVMNFEGSPQCGNAGDMKFDVSIQGVGSTLDPNGFVFDSVKLSNLFDVLREGRWRGSCEGIGIFCAEWLLLYAPGVERVTVRVKTESGNELEISLTESDMPKFGRHAIRRA